MFFFRGGPDLQQGGGRLNPGGVNVGVGVGVAQVAVLLVGSSRSQFCLWGAPGPKFYRKKQ